MTRILRFEGLAQRHPIDPSQLDSCSNAAKVRLEVHHSPPVDFTLSTKGVDDDYVINWIAVDPMLARSYANEDDAKRDGAYAIALAAIEEVDGLVGVGRAETRTGADYYLVHKDTIHDSDVMDFENAIRFEVSGTDGTVQDIQRRLKIKLDQARRGRSSLPAIAAVVGFKSKLVLLESA